MPEFLIVLLLWLGLLDPTVSYTTTQVQDIATTNSSLIEQTSSSVDTTSVSWQLAREHQRDIVIIDPRER